MISGWVKIHRQIMENPMWESEPFTRSQAWIDMVMLANHSPGHIRVRGNIVNLSRGQLGWSRPALALRWEWSRGKVARFMQTLENEQQIVQQKSFITSVITITNYEHYQGNGTADSTADSTADGQQTVQQTDPNKKDKKDKKTTPAIMEVEEYFTSKGSTATEATKFYEHFSLADWHDSRGKKIKVWKQNAAGWIRRNTPAETKKLTLKEKDKEGERLKKLNPDKLTQPERDLLYAYNGRQMMREDQGLFND